jgi:hypothetical protein
MNNGHRRFKRRKPSIKKILSALIKRLPSTYPQITLIKHSSLKDLYRHYWGFIVRDSNNDPFVFCDGEDNSIHVPSCLIKYSKYDIAFYLLHEIGHLRALQKYGHRDVHWSNYKTAERFADSFAYRWCRTLRMENFFN